MCARWTQRKPFHLETSEEPQKVADGNVSWIDDLTADRAFQPLNQLLDDPKFRHGPYL